MQAVDASQFKIPKELMFTLVVVFALVIQYIITMYTVVMRVRLQVFRRKFMNQFDAMHKKAFPDKAKAPEFGYPDSGNGFYGKKLAYPDWFIF